LNDFVNVINSHFICKNELIIEEKIILKLKNYLLPCKSSSSSSSYMLNYVRMFSNLNELAMNIYNLLDDIFSLMNTSHSGYLTIDEIEKVIQKINKNLNTNYDSNVFQNINNYNNNNNNNIGNIGFKEFKNYFARVFNLKIDLF